MPLFKFTVKVESTGTYYVEADNAEDVRSWQESGDNPKNLQTGPTHDPSSSTEIEKIEELTATAV